MAKLATVATLNDEKPLWYRQEGEPTLWWNRFKRYRGLGAKRSLQAAFEQERGEIKALESTKSKSKSSAQNLRESTRIYEKNSLKPVPTKPQVPGSWKQASIKWHWVERAEAYDSHVIDTIVENTLDDVLEGASLGFTRIKGLKSILKALQEIYNENYKVWTIEQILQCMARMQSIMKDIREEMSQYDEALTRVALKKQAKEIYSSDELQEVTKKQKGG